MEMASSMRAQLCTRRNGVFHVGLVEARGYDLEKTEDVTTRSYAIGKKTPVKYCVREGWRYNMSTQNGDCGGMLVAMEPRLQHKFIGMHVAGGRANYGYATLVTFEMVQEALELLGETIVAQGCMVDTCVRPDSELEVKALSRFGWPEGNFRFLGVIDPKLGTLMPQKTTLKPSIIFDQVREHVTEPSVLKSNDPRIEGELQKNIVMIGVEKYGGPSAIFEPRRLDDVVEDINAILATSAPKKNCRVLTMEESVAGLPDDEYMQRINIHSAPGYPWILTRPQGAKGKEYMFDFDEENCVLKDEKVKRAVEHRLALAKRGEMVQSIWTPCTKDERRPIKKVKSASTRIFTIGPVDYTIVHRMYCLAFSAHLSRSRLTSFSAVGIDPYSYEWTMLAQRLLSMSNNLFGFDYSKYDGMLPAQLVERVADIVNRWYDDGEECARVRRVLFLEASHATHIVGNALYECVHGNPSGNPYTVVINTVVNAMFLRYAWQQLVPLEYRSMVHYNEHVRDIFYGDDGLIAVSTECRGWFNLETVAAYLKSIDIDVSMPDKLSAIIPYAPIERWDFLKNGFRKDEFGHWRPEMSKDTIYELTNWIRTGGPHEEEESVVLNCRDALHFAFHYGFDFFTELRNKISDALVKQGVTPTLPTFREENELWLTKVA